MSTKTQESSSSPQPQDGEMPTKYRSADHESDIRSRWDHSGAFHADPRRVLSGEALPYCILIPPPNVTAPLHLGHALNNTLQDVLVRARRMMGFETLWLPGTDHAGIATQTVVDKRLKAEGKPAIAELRKVEGGRASFIKTVQAFKDEYEARITHQLKMMGCSCDWDRQRFTMDAMCARAVREAFFKLFEDGLIYRGKRIVNWDPVTQTALADDEVEMEEIKGHFYYLRYTLVHEPTNPDDPFDVQEVTWDELDRRGYPGANQQQPDENAWVTIATTRPETYLGDTAVAVNPRDPRAASLDGLFVQLPIVGRVIPILEDDYVVLADPESADPKARFATGFLKVTPAHDPNDYEIGRRHNLPQINVMAPDASISDEHGWLRESLGEGGHVFLGKSREEARELVVKEFKARNLLEDIKPYVHSVGHSYRSHAAIEPYLSDQWYVKVTDDRLRGAALRAMNPEQRNNGEYVLNSGADDSGAGVSRTDSSTSISGAGVSPADSSTSGTGVLRADSNTSGAGVSPVNQSASVFKMHIRRLPHWEKGGSTYFVTFRLKQGILTEQEQQIVLDACMHWHGSRIKLHLVTVMSDHVHLIMAPLRKDDGSWWSLEELMHSIKGFSAHEIQRLRGELGPLWQDEYFDRLIRDKDEYCEKFNYMLNNPIKKGLASKPWEYLFTRKPECMLSQEDFVREGGRDAHPTGLGPVDSENEGDGQLAFYPERYAKTFETWHENLRDWCISRQLWWGHRIPVWSKTCEDEQQAIAVVDTWQKAGHEETCARNDGPMVHVCVRDENAAACETLLREGFVHDPDVLDTWFSSALWPLSTLGWPEHTLTAPTKETLYPAEPDSIVRIFVKHVGDWHAFVGTEDERSGELVELLLHLRDKHDAKPIVYELFSQQDMTKPLHNPEEIASCKDLLCAVGVRTKEAVHTDKAGLVDLSAWLISHGFVDTVGLLEAFNPTSVLCTAREIITLWVSRMVMFNRYFLGEAKALDGSVIGGTALRAVYGSPLLNGVSLNHAALQVPVFQPHPVKGFVPRDPYPKGERASLDLQRSDRNLPHLTLNDATYFVTWRAVDGVRLRTDERAVVLEAFRHWLERGVKVFAAVVMSDHVHVLMKPDHAVDLAEVLSSIKRFTAREINKIRGKQGSLWQDENFDHIVRDEMSFAEFLYYIIHNPTKKALCVEPGAWDATVVHTDVAEAFSLVHGSESRATESRATESRATTCYIDGNVPFKDVFIHAMIQDGSGQKMSKSLGNGVDPLDIIVSHGADALRYTLVKMTTQTQDVRMPVDLICPHCHKTFEPKLLAVSSGYMVAAPEQTCSACKKSMVTAYGVSQGIEPTEDKPLGLNSSSKFDEARNFCNKLWNASRFALGILRQPLSDDAKMLGDKTPGEMLPLPDRWILSRLAGTIKTCEQALVSYQFSTYATTLYDFLWRDFCDWYLEAIKPTVQQNQMQRAVLAHVLDAMLRLLHPVTPFVTEVIWEHLQAIHTPRIDGLLLEGARKDNLLATAGWPRIDSAWESPEAEALFGRVQELVGVIREVRAQQRVAPRRKIALHAPEPIIELLVLTDPIVSTLAGLCSITHDEPTGPSSPARFEGHDIHLSDLADAVDADAERERIERSIAENSKKAAALQGRLANPGYVERAPEHLVAQTREQLATVQAEIEAFKMQLEQLK